MNASKHHLAAFAALSLLGPGRVLAQGGSGLRCSSVVMQGGTIDVEVGASDTTVQVTDGSLGGTSTHSVPPDRKVSIPVPAVPGGTILAVSVGRGLRATVILVEVIAL